MYLALKDPFTHDKESEVTGIKGGNPRRVPKAPKNPDRFGGVLNLEGCQEHSRQKA